MGVAAPREWGRRLALPLPLCELRWAVATEVRRLGAWCRGPRGASNGWLEAVRLEGLQGAWGHGLQAPV